MGQGGGLAIPYFVLPALVPIHGRTYLSLSVASTVRSYHPAQTNHRRLTVKSSTPVVKSSQVKTSQVKSSQDKSSQVKSSCSGATRPRGDHVRTLIFSSPYPSGATRPRGDHPYGTLAYFSSPHPFSTRQLLGTAASSAYFKSIIHTITHTLDAAVTAPSQQ